MQTGQYDQLYSISDLLWGEKPGRVIDWYMKLVDGLPARVLDLGAGDGKNAIFFEQLSVPVDCVDISSFAFKAYERRFIKEKLKPKGRYIVCDVNLNMEIDEKYDCVISYGLGHCLSDEELSRHFYLLKRAVQVGGYICFSALIDGIPIPSNHKTGRLYLRKQMHYAKLFEGLEVIYSQNGEIEETHPSVSKHKHKALWILAKNV